MEAMTLSLAKRGRSSEATTWACSIRSTAVPLAIGFGDGFENIEGDAVGAVADGVKIELDPALSRSMAIALSLSGS